MIVLGIDPGLSNTGWGVVETRGSLSRARAYGDIHTSSTDAIDVRLGIIFREVRAVIERYDPGAVAVEKVFFGQNSRSAIATAQARGAALAACAELGRSVGEYSPAEIKQAVTGVGSADKRQMTFMMRTLLALDHDPKPDHAADALAAALCYAHTAQSGAAIAARGQGVERNRP